MVVFFCPVCVNRTDKSHGELYWLPEPCYVLFIRPLLAAIGKLKHLYPVLEQCFCHKREPTRAVVISYLTQRSNTNRGIFSYQVARSSLFTKRWCRLVQISDENCVDDSDWLAVGFRPGTTTALAAVSNLDLQSLLASTKSVILEVVVIYGDQFAWQVFGTLLWYGSGSGQFLTPFTSVARTNKRR